MNFRPQLQATIRKKTRQRGGLQVMKKDLEKNDLGLLTSSGSPKRLL